MLIDFHMHLPDGTSDGERWEAEDFVDMMDEAGIDIGCIFTHDGFFHENHPVSNQQLYESSLKFPDRLIPFCTVNPKQGRAAIDEARRCLSGLHMRGIKLHPWLQGFTPFLPAMEELCRLAIEYDVPILFHDGTPPNSTPLQIGYLAYKFPACKIVLGHGGLMHLWQDAIAAVNRYANVSVCLSGTAPAAIVRKVMLSVPADRLLFGTDVFYKTQRYVANNRITQLRGLDVDDALKTKMLRDNPLRLLKLAGAAEAARKGEAGSA